MTRISLFRSLSGALATLALSSGSCLGVDRPWVPGAPENADRQMATMSDQLPRGPPIAGRIVAVDRAAARVEIEFRPTDEVSEGDVTMFFRVSDPDLLLGHTPGDKIRFSVKGAGRGRVIDWIENSN